MSGLVDGLLSSICHRGGLHADVLPLCLRCSSVYAGVLIGVAFETVLRTTTKTVPNRAALLINIAALVLMGVVGLGGLYGFVTVPAWFKVFVALFFGAAIGFFAVSTAAHELGAAGSRRRVQTILRCILLLALGVGAVGATSEWQGAVRALGVVTAVGIVVTFATVNFAFGLVLLRRMKGAVRRIGIAALLAPGLIAAEFALFALWRKMIVFV